MQPLNSGYKENKPLNKNLKKLKACGITDYNHKAHKSY